MVDNQTLRKHAALVDRMATTLGVDLEEEVMAGRLDDQALPDMVLRCTGCTQPDACAAWLETPHGAAADAPRYCRNAWALDLMRKC
jgi:hypothetical protein